MDEEVLPGPLRAVLCDLRECRAGFPEVREEGAWYMLYAADGSGAGVRVEEGPEPLVLAGIAEQVQEWAVEALWQEGLPAVWPECPAHPRTHPLAATVAGGTAVWSCPRSGRVVAPVGELGRCGRDAGTPAGRKASGG
ncbi:hypothetical protein [Streptomyces hoynatensis]|uniref:Uncharacterized protein n=1 Tax=Streptomyces hoynatensis TaxID=1141874 RepID=A0A3A9Z936_9ACTN|nr:hypothetical protein [Streptomyces hoynatensis]RKN43836.1 hypothetical protein D7294_08990 [Streptomyces hoynatensis]